MPILFDGTDDAIDCGDIDALDGVSAFTISAWVKWEAFLNWGHLFGKYQDANNRIAICGWGTSPALTAFVANGGNAYGYTSFGTIDSVNWHHICIVYDGSGATNPDRLKIYINGAPQTLTFGGAAIPATTPSTVEEVAWGAANNVGYLPGNLKIDDVAIWGVPLTARQAKNLACGIRGLPVLIEPDDLIQYLPTNEDTAGTAVPADADYVRDLSGNGNHGTKVGDPYYDEGRLSYSGRVEVHHKVTPLLIEPISLHLRIHHGKYDTGGAELAALHLAYQERASFEVQSEQELRFLLGNFIIDTQDVRFIIAKYITDEQEVRFNIAAYVFDDQETRFILGNFVADEQELRHVLANFVGDGQEVRFAIAGGVVTEQELRFILGNFVTDTQDVRFIIAKYVTDEQELRFLLGNFVADEQELRFILANFYRRNCPIYFYIEGIGIVVYEPAEGYLLDDSYISERDKVGRLLEVRYTIAPWPKVPVTATRRVEFTIGASEVGGLPGLPTEPEYVLQGSAWYMLGLSLDPGSYKIHDQFCDDFGHISGQYYVVRWSAAAQQYLPAITPTTACQTEALALGEGFWLFAPVGQLETIGTPVTGEQSVALVVGWNLIATPYNIRMDNILVEYQGARQPLNYSADKVSGIFFMSLEPWGGYAAKNVANVPPDVILTQRGYWVKAFVGCNLIFRKGLT